ncbi:hypothetical protein GCM10027346_36220 [Hymenobacter seoulensis]
MKFLYYVGWISILLLGACSTESTTTTPPQVQPPPSPARHIAASPLKTVEAFLRWYQLHVEQLNTMPTVPAAGDGDTANVYRVDFQAVEGYLALLHSSDQVTPTYLQTQRRHFEHAQDTLQAHPQTDGLVVGLDYDRVLFTQDAEAQVALLLGTRPTHVLVSQDSAQVLYQWQESQMSEGPNLTFSLVPDHDHWVINAIRPTWNN